MSKSRSKTKTQVQFQSTIFTSLTFSIYEYGSDLACKRAKLMEDIIKNNGGNLIQIKESKFLTYLINLF